MHAVIWTPKETIINPITTMNAPTSDLHFDFISFLSHPSQSANIISTFNCHVKFRQNANYFKLRHYPQTESIDSTKSAA